MVRICFIDFNRLSSTYHIFFKILWNNRLKNDKGNDCLISVDGTGFMIQELGRDFYSFKF